MSNDLVKCTNCKKDKEINCFMKKDKQLKQCDRCRLRLRQSKIKNKCPCGKDKHRCKIHGGNALCPCGRRKDCCKIHDGVSICPCGKHKDYCKIHGGNALCPCDKRKYDCKIHGGSSLCPCGNRKLECKIHNDAREITIKNMIINSKRRDEKNSLFDENQFIDKQFVSNLLDLYQNCIYCNCKLNFDKCNPQLATIERLDNSLGHIKRNCVIACFTCNVGRVGDKYN